MCDYTLNKKDDWNSSRLPRLIVEVRGELVEEGGKKGAKKRGAAIQKPIEGQVKKVRLQAQTQVPSTLPSTETSTPKPKPDKKVEAAPNNDPKTPEPPKPNPSQDIRFKTKEEPPANPTPKWVKLGP